PSSCSSPISRLAASSACSIAGTERAEPCSAAVAGLASVLAGSLIRGDLQAHLAVARVAEQSPPSTATLLLVRTDSRQSPDPCRRARPTVCRDSSGPGVARP